MPALTTATIERLNDAMTKLLEAAALLRIVHADYAVTFPTRIQPILVKSSIEEIESLLRNLAADRERMRAELLELKKESNRG